MGAPAVWVLALPACGRTVRSLRGAPSQPGSQQPEGGPAPTPNAGRRRRSPGLRASRASEQQLGWCACGIIVALCAAPMDQSHAAPHCFLSAERSEQCTGCYLVGGAAYPGPRWSCRPRCWLGSGFAETAACLLGCGRAPRHRSSRGLDLHHGLGAVHGALLVGLHIQSGSAPCRYRMEARGHSVGLLLRGAPRRQRWAAGQAAR